MRRIGIAFSGTLDMLSTVSLYDGKSSDGTLEIIHSREATPPILILPIFIEQIAGICQAQMKEVMQCQV